MKQAIIKIGSRQFNIEEGSVIRINAMSKPSVVKVLFYTDGKNSYIGTPEVEDVVIKTSLVEEIRGRKMKVGRFKSKSRYDKSKGYRDLISVLRVDRLSHKADKDSREVDEVKTTSEKKSVEKKSVKKEVKPTRKSKVTKKKE